MSPRRLPAQPSLEQLRKQAKELLDRYRGGDAAAIAEVEHHERRPNPAAFALHDAQRVLARSYGFSSWPKLKAFVDGVTVARLAEAVQSGDLDRVRTMLEARPELAIMDMAENNEHRALHFAVLRRDVPMVRLLMQQGADARQGIFPHRAATTAFAIARDREYHEVSAAIEEEEQRRRAELSCPNLTISPLQDQIADAIRQGDRAAAIRLLETDLSLIRACDRLGATPLHAAACELDCELVRWLLERGASVRKRDLQGLTPLDRAALAGERGFAEAAKLLLDRGAEITIRAAVAMGDGERVREWIAAEPELLRQMDNSGGLVTLAVHHGQLEMVRLLLDLGADVDERITLEQVEEPTPSWGFPLWHAALENRLEIVRLLLDRGADPNANVYASGWPLRNAWNHEDQAVKRLLLERGAKVQPYMVVEFHEVEEARRLLAANPSEELASEMAWSGCDSGCPEIVEMALPLLPWARDSYNWQWVLIQPVRGAHAESAANQGHFRCMELLMRHGIDPNISRYGQTALHFAAAYHGPVGDEDRARFAAMLIDHGARLDMRDDLLRSTPLGWACRWGRVALAKLLIARGAPVDEPDAEPWATPEAWARKMGHDAILALLTARP